MVVWSEDKNIRQKDILPVPCVFGMSWNGITVGLQKRMRGQTDELHGKTGERIQTGEVPPKSMVRDLGIRENAEPFLFVGFPEGQPFTELVLGNAVGLTEVLDRMKSGKEFAKDAEDKEKAVTRVRYDDIREHGMCVGTAVTEYPQDAQVRLIGAAIFEINDGSAVVGMDMTVPGAPADGTGLKLRLEMFHVRVKKGF